MNINRLCPPTSLSAFHMAAAPAVREAEVTGRTVVPEEPLRLWYQQPAKKWEEALPLGNGRLGAADQLKTLRPRNGSERREGPGKRVSGDREANG